MQELYTPPTSTESFQTEGLVNQSGTGQDWPPIAAGRCIHYELAPSAGGQVRRRRVWRFSGRLLKRALDCASGFAFATRYGQKGESISKIVLLRRLAHGDADFDLRVGEPRDSKSGSFCQWTLMSRGPGDDLAFDAPSPDYLRREVAAAVDRNKLDKATRLARRKAVVDCAATRAGPRRL